MAVIDSLVLELGLDPAKFTQGQRNAIGSLRKFQEQAVAGGKEIEAQGAKSERYFGDLKRNILQIGALMVGGRGAKELLGFITNLDAQTGRFAHTLGSTVPNLARWQGAAEQVGGTADTIAGTLGGLRHSMDSFLGGSGGGEFLPLLNRFNVSMFDSNRQLRDSGEIILDLVEAMKAQGVEIPRIAAYLRLLPGMNEQSINLFIQGRKAVDAYREAASRAGGATKESADAAAEYQRQLALLSASATDLGRTLLGMVLPALIATTNGMQNLIQAAKKQELGTRAFPGEPGSLRYDAVRAMLFGNKPEDVDDAIRKILGGSGGVFGALAGKPNPATPVQISAEFEARIRRVAIASGKDPEAAVAAAKNEPPPRPTEPLKPAPAQALEPPRPPAASPEVPKPPPLPQPPRPPAASPEVPKPPPLPQPPRPPAGQPEASRAQEPMRRYAQAAPQEPPKPPPAQQEPPRPAPVAPETALRSPVREFPPGAVPYLNAKPGAFSGRESPAVMALARRIQETEPGLQRFTAGNDAYHSRMPSKHNQGLALDFTVRKREEADAIADRLQKMLGKDATVINEYDPRRRTPFTTAPHIHVQFNDAAAAERYAAGGIRPGAAQAVPPAGATTNDSSRTTTVTNTTNIQSVTIQTQATDAQGIAGSMEDWLKRMSVAAPADSGQR